MKPAMAPRQAPAHMEGRPMAPATLAKAGLRDVPAQQREGSTGGEGGAEVSRAPAHIEQLTRYVPLC